MASSAGYNTLKTFNVNTDEETAKDLYDKWAIDYDKDISSHDYIGYKTCVEIFNAEMKKVFQEERFGKRIVDAGAGTGLVGQHLKDLGYTNIDGLDISQEMLNIARDKGIYKNLICAPLSEKKIEQIETGCYDALISSGTISVGHVKPPAFDEIIRIVKPGGIICFTLRQDAYDTETMGYKNKMDELTEAKTWELIERKLTSYHGNTGTQVLSSLDNCYVCTYKVLPCKYE